MMTTVPDVGLYIHYPFCRRKCSYCDFYSEERGLNRRTQYHQALLKELDLRLSTARAKVATVYIGGGSPNLIPPAGIAEIFRKIRSDTRLGSNSELSIELNPGAVSKSFLTALKSLGINRVSIGAQSFHDDELKTLGRSHQSADIMKLVERLKDLPIANFGLDLIFGIPGQTLSSWEKSLEYALQTAAEHLSLYCLSLEKGTALTNACLSGILQPLDEQIEWSMYQTAAWILAEAGYEHYEISNWAKPGRFSRHNQRYWSGKTYYGFGPAAHSFDGQRRWWNVASIDEYISRLENDTLPVERSEILSPSEKITELFQLKLRTSDGLTDIEYQKLTGIAFDDLIDRMRQFFGAQFDRYFEFDGKRLRSTLEGWFVNDYLVTKLLALNEELQDGD